MRIFGILARSRHNALKWYAHEVARPAEWIQHLDEALAELRAPTVDRAAVQELLQVSARQSVRLLARLGAHQAGKSLVVDRQDLIARLKMLKADPLLQF